MLNSYYGEITGLRPPWEQYPISRERLEKIERYAHASDKARSAGAELLLNYGLKNCVNGFVPPAAFETGNTGSPLLSRGRKGWFCRMEIRYSTIYPIPEIMLPV